MSDEKSKVVLHDIDVPFWRVVVILIKWSIAAIPAAIVLMIVYLLLAAIVGGVIILTGNAPLSPPN